MANDPRRRAARQSARFPPRSSNAWVNAATMPGRSAPTAVTAISFIPGRYTPTPPQRRSIAPVNTALWVTAVRISTIPMVMALLLINSDHTRWWAAGLYAFAAATDSLDGWLARARGQVTVAGAFLDPLADKLLVSAALVCLLQLGLVSAWAAMIIITREFAVTGLRLVAVNERLIIPAGRLGKAKTLSQNIALFALIAPHRWGWIN